MEAAEDVALKSPKTISLDLFGRDLMVSRREAYWRSFLRECSSFFLAHSSLDKPVGRLACSE